uniref:Uncharacterized protein n=1 Tax=Anopheles quadriannulatus TaxID=34691 RepID=A0A182XSA6_ANOQN
GQSLDFSLGSYGQSWDVLFFRSRNIRLPVFKFYHVLVRDPFTVGLSIILFIARWRRISQQILQFSCGRKHTSVTSVEGKECERGVHTQHTRATGFLLDVFNNKTKHKYLRDDLVRYDLQLNLPESRNGNQTEPCVV